MKISCLRNGQGSGDAIKKMLSVIGGLFLFSGLAVLTGLSGCLAGSGGDDEWDGSSDWYSDGIYSSTTVIGPAGGVIEVVDPGSSLYGFKIVIPAGTFDSNATIIVDEDFGDPWLPDGLENQGPEIEITADKPLLKEIQIFFPLQSTSGNNDKMICAFYWDSVDASWWDQLSPDWQIKIPESMNGLTMIVRTQLSGSWSWGEVNLDEVEAETLESLLDDNFGSDFLDRLADAFELEALKLINWSNLDYCANQAAIWAVLVEIRDDAEIRAEGFLQSVNGLCNVWGYPPTIGDIFYGIEEVIDIHLQYLGQSIASEGLEMIPYIGGVLSIMAKASAQAVYEKRLGNLKDEYACIFREAQAGLWINVGLYYLADAAMLGMQLVEINSPCTP